MKLRKAGVLAVFEPSPSTRREWIEMVSVCSAAAAHWRLPPHGGSGLKYLVPGHTTYTRMSPSTRREWIEIALGQAIGYALDSLPPHGGSGLKS